MCYVRSEFRRHGILVAAKGVSTLRAIDAQLSELGHQAARLRCRGHALFLAEVRIPRATRVDALLAAAGASTRPRRTRAPAPTVMAIDIIFVPLPERALECLKRSIINIALLTHLPNGRLTSNPSLLLIPFLGSFVVMGSLQTISVTSEDGVEGAKGRSKLVPIVAGVVVLAGAIAGIVVGVSAGGKSSDPCSGIDTSAAVTINLEPNWGDYSTCSGDTGSTCTGIVSPLVTAVCAAAGLTCTQSVVEWSTIWDGSIGSGFSDGSVQIAAGARNTGPRQDECMAFSNPYTVPGVGVVLATAAIETTPPAKGASATFCSLTGWAVGTDYLNEAPTKQTGVFSMNYDITVVEHLDFAALLAAHAAGTCHYSLVEPGAVDGGSLKEIETITAADHRVGGVSFMADGTDPNTECLISKLNTGLAVVRKNGELTALAVGKSVDAVELTAEVTNSDTCTRPGPTLNLEN